MDIKILKNIDNYKNRLLKKDYVLETFYDENGHTGIPRVKYVVFDIQSNIRKEVLPDVEKYALGIIKIVSLNDEHIYFFTIVGKKIILKKFNYITEQCEDVLCIEDDISMYPIAKRLKVFVLNESYVLVQHEYIRTNKEETCSGFFAFESFLYNYQENQLYPVMDENIVQNGISEIVEISENMCVMKTGYSLLEDERYKYLTREEVSVESISIVNVGQFISDIIISQTNITVDTIQQTFFTHTIPYIQVESGYLIYSTIDNIEHEEELFFYNLETKDIVNCINKNVDSEETLASHHIIGGEPYISLKKANVYEFINLKKAKVEFRFENDMELLNVNNDLFLFAGTKSKGIIRKETPVFEVYSYPGLNCIISEKGECTDLIWASEDDIYIFTK